MATKITVNGVSYDNVEAMPPDVKRLYDETLAKLPELADQDGDGVPDIVQHQGLTVRNGTTVRKKFIVNGTTYDDVNAMPPDVRDAYQKAMQAMSAGGPNVKKSEIKMSFQVTGPGFTFRRGSDVPSLSPPIGHSVGTSSNPQPVEAWPTAKPIEPDSAGSGLRIALTLGACLAGALVIWFLARAH
jgi:hypothetical protein